MLRPRVLWVSQIAAPDARLGRCLPDERNTAPPSLPGADVTVVDATTEPLPAPNLFDAVVIGGSIGCVHDPEPWRITLIEWTRGLGELPFLGICGGHQLVVLARGGAVERGGHTQIGLHPCDVPELTTGLVMHSHEDAVVTLPEGAQLWAQDAVCIQALRFGPAQWTFQFHPEPSPEIAPFLWRSHGHEYPEPVVNEAVALGAKIMAAWTEAVVTTLTARG